MTIKPEHLKGLKLNDEYPEPESEIIYKKPPEIVAILRYIGWTIFVVGCILILISTMSSVDPSPKITLAVGVLSFIQGIVVCALFNALASMLIYLFEIKESLKK